MCKLRGREWRNGNRQGHAHDYQQSSKNNSSHVLAEKKISEVLEVAWISEDNDDALHGIEGIQGSGQCWRVCVGGHTHVNSYLQLQQPHHPHCLSDDVLVPCDGVMHETCYNKIPCFWVGRRGQVGLKSKLTLKYAHFWSTAKRRGILFRSRLSVCSLSDNNFRKPWR